MIKHEEVINKMFNGICYGQWENPRSLNRAQINMIHAKGKTVQSLSNDIETGLAMGFSIEQQIEAVKIETFNQIKKRK